LRSCNICPDKDIIIETLRAAVAEARQLAQTVTGQSLDAPKEETKQSTVKGTETKTFDKSVKAT
jgi:cobalamin biosynthesis protein CbiG